MSTASEQLYGPEHVEHYEATDGEMGHEWRNGTSILILTTRGHKSGQTRRTALIYRRRGDEVYVVASNGGTTEHPAWYLNLLEEPEVGVQIREDRYTARARTAGDEEQRELWPLMAEAWPDYDGYQAKTDRPIPVVVLERA